MSEDLVLKVENLNVLSARETKGILEIVKEDILEAIENNGGKAPLSRLKPEIKVSRSFISKAVGELEKENLIRIKENSVCLTREGIKKAKDIVKKHFVLEDYFGKTRSRKDAYKAASILEHYVSTEVIDNIKKLSTLKKEGTPLTEFKQKEGLITDIIFNVRLFERIISMGICPGERVKITNKLSNAIIVKIENKKFALSKNIAKKIKVLEYERS
jgi:Mn-dependent DtxR family transcriptional regulator